MRSTTYRFLVDLGAGLPLISEDPLKFGLVSEFYALAALCFCCDFVVYSMTPSFVLGGMYSVGC